MSRLVIDDLDDVVLETLRASAEKHGRSVEEEAVVILSRSIESPSAGEGWRRKARSIAAMTPKSVVQTPSERLVREDRSR